MVAVRTIRDFREDGQREHLVGVIAAIAQARADKRLAAGVTLADEVAWTADRCEESSKRPLDPMAAVAEKLRGAHSRYEEAQ